MPELSLRPSARTLRGLCLAGMALAAAAIGQAQTGIITTVAGNGTAGFTGDAGTATAAELSAPFSAVSVGGNLYIADQVNNRIRVVNSSGTINTFAGAGASGYSGDGAKATAAGLGSPTGVAVDGSGNVYIADTINNVIRKVASSGNISTYAGLNIQGFGGDNGPATGAQFNHPSGLVLDGSGNLYIADTSNNCIRKITASTGIITTIAGGVTPGYAGDGGPASKATFNTPQGLALDSAGNLYIADTNNSVIRKITTANVITTVAGIGSGGFAGDGGQARFATLSHPRGVAVDAAGDVFIADTFNNRIRVVTPNAIITTVVGTGLPGYTGDSGAANKATLNNPSGVSFDSSGNLYITDNNNNAVRVYKPAAANTGTPPAISTGGIISAANFGAFTAVAPGSWVEIYGANLAAGTQQWAGSDFQGVNAPTSLGGTTVTIAGLNAYIDYVSAGQVNAQIPAGIGTGVQKVVLNTAAGASASYNLTVNATEPGLYAPANFLIGGKQYVAALFQDGKTFVAPPGSIAGITSRQAHPGEIITIYGVGFGAVSTGTLPGQIAQQTNSLTLPFSVQFGQANATLNYFGLAPGSVGLYQFNVIVPSIASNDAVPVTFLLSGTAAPQTLYTAVQN